MSMGKHISYQKEGEIAVITLCNAKGFNLVGDKFLQELVEAQDMADADKSLRAVLINAEGDHFSAGIDLSFLQNVSPQFIMDNLVWLQRVYSRWQEMPMPVVVAIQGLCYGSAMELILGCDLRMCADNTRFSIPEVRFGLSPDMGGTTRLTQLVGIGQAKRMIMGCEEVLADEALRIGLVEYVVPLEELPARSMKLVKRLAGLPPIAQRFAKKGINVANESSVTASLLFEQAQSTFCCGTYDQKEGIASFFEKRKANYEGR